MNLYIFNESSRAAVYGIGTYIRELTSALKDSDINVCVVHLRSDQAEKEPEVTDGIRHFYIPAPVNQNTSLTRNRQSELYYLNVVYLLRLQIKNTEKLVFHLNHNQNNKFAEILKRKFDCKIVTVVHYFNWRFSVYDNLQRLRPALNEEYLDSFGETLKKSEVEKSLWVNVDRVICLSNYMQEILCQYCRITSSTISVIPNGLTDHAKIISDVKFLRKKWKIALKEKVILFAGRLDEVKGLEYLLNAFREVLHTFPRCRLVIAGDGDYNKYTKESQDICTRITYTGLLGKDQLYEWYCLADMGIIPSLFEPFGYVAVEMMMHGLPIVATATSGLNEVVDGTCGFKIPIIEHSDRVEIDTAILAEKIIYLLQHSAESKKMGQNGRNRYLKEFTSESFKQKMLDFYYSLYDS